MAGAQQQQQQGGGDHSLGPLWITLGLFLLGWAIWHYFHVQIVAGIYAVRVFEVNTLSLFVPGLEPIKEWMAQHPPSVGITIDDLFNVSTAVGKYLRYPVIAILAILSVVLYFSSVTSRFKKTYSMQSLVEEECDNWPVVKPLVKLDLINTPLDEEPWAMSLAPLAFARKFGMLGEKRTLQSTETSGRTIQSVYTLEKTKARKAFAMQLGRFWSGLEHLKPHERAIFAGLCAKADRNDKGFRDFMDKISSSFAEGKPDYSGTRELLVKHIKNPDVGKIVHSHAYVLTVMASMLELAREDGVIAAAAFLWIKPIDRKLWYMLNNVGRRTAFCEISGAYAHWLMEKELARKVLVPAVDEAVIAMEKALSEITAPRDEPGS